MSTPSSVTIRLFIRATSARITSFTASLSTEGFASSCHAPCPRQQPKGRWAGETLTLQQPQHRGTVLGSLINLTHEPAYLGYSALAQKTRCGSVEGLPYIEAAGLKQNPKTPLFRSTRGRTCQLTDKGMSRVDAFRVVQRRAKTWTGETLTVH